LHSHEFAAPQPGDRVSPGIFVISDGMGLVAKRIEHAPNSEPAKVVIRSLNPENQTYERVAEELNTVGRLVWAAQRLQCGSATIGRCSRREMDRDGNGYSRRDHRCRQYRRCRMGLRPVGDLVGAVGHGGLGLAGARPRAAAAGVFR
jgi:hypothetical protein